MVPLANILHIEIITGHPCVHDKTMTSKSNHIVETQTHGHGNFRDLIHINCGNEISYLGFESLNVTVISRSDSQPKDHYVNHIRCVDNTHEYLV